MNSREVKKNAGRWIEVPKATYGVFQGPAHGIDVIHARISDSSAFVGVIYVEREGQPHPSVAIAHIDDRATVYESVVQMEKALCPSFWACALSLTRLPPITKCRAGAFAFDKDVCDTFIRAARQNFWGEHIEADAHVLPALRPRQILTLSYFLGQKEWLFGSVLEEGHQVKAKASHMRRILQRQSVPKGEIGQLCIKRAKSAKILFGPEVLDEARMNYTGADMVRGPVLKAFDLRLKKLKDYDIKS